MRSRSTASSSWTVVDDGMLLDAPTPSVWLATHLAARFDEWAEDGAVDDGAARRWWRLEELLADDAAALRALHTKVMADDGVPAPAAATYLAGWIGGALADVIGFALAAASAGIVADVAQVRWRQHPDGWMDRVELGTATAIVEPAHRWAGQQGVEVANGADLRARTIDVLVGVLTPVIDACHRLARVGKAGLWNEVADPLGMAVAFQVAVPAVPAVLDRLAAAVRTPGVPWRAHPDLRIVDCDFGAVYVGQKGGCCLAYTRPRDGDHADEAEEPDEDQRAYRERFPSVPGAPHYCSTCSFRDWADTEARQLFWLEREHTKQTEAQDDHEHQGATR